MFSTSLCIYTKTAPETYLHFLFKLFLFCRNADARCNPANHWDHCHIHVTLASIGTLWDTKKQSNERAVGDCRHAKIHHHQLWNTDKCLETKHNSKGGGRGLVLGWGGVSWWGGVSGWWLGVGMGLEGYIIGNIDVDVENFNQNNTLFPISLVSSEFLTYLRTSCFCSIYWL